MRFASFWCLGLAVSACAVEPSSKPTELSATSETDFLSPVLEQSCPDGVDYQLPEKIAISANPIVDIGADPDAINGLEYVGGFHITSDDKRLGGLSGLEFLDYNTLLAVTDFGNLVWIDFDEDEDGLSLSSSAYITALKDAEGTPLSRKKNLDAESLDWNGERLLVSFERNHRILGYDLEGCGANARGIELLSFDTAKADGVNKIKSNRGMEALAGIDSSTLIIGVETPGKTGPVYARFSGGGEPLDFSEPLPMIGAQLLTGADVISSDGGDRLYTVHRSYDPVTGNQVSIVETALETGLSERLGTLKKPGIVDNFEGIAATDTGEETRIAIISDDNFSNRQKSLLLFFEVADAP